MAGVGLPARGDPRTGRPRTRRGGAHRAGCRWRPDGAHGRRGDHRRRRRRGPRDLVPLVMGTPITTLLLAAAAGGLAAVAVREAVVATPSVARWVAATLEPLGALGRRATRRAWQSAAAWPRSARCALLLVGLAILGPVPAAALAVAGPAAATAAIRRRRGQYRLAVDRGVCGAALAIADALSGGRSLRAALVAAPETLEGPAAIELARVTADLDLGDRRRARFGG